MSTSNTTTEHLNDRERKQAARAAETLAKIEAKRKARAARAASADVRQLERTLNAVKAALEAFTFDERERYSIKEAIRALEKALDSHRNAATDATPPLPGMEEA